MTTLPIRLLDRAKEACRGVSTGIADSIILEGEPAGFISLSGIGHESSTYYTLENGDDWEVGLATYSTGAAYPVDQTTNGRLIRGQILDSSNSGNAIDLASDDTADVFITLPAEKIIAFTSGVSVNEGSILFSDNGSGIVNVSDSLIFSTGSPPTLTINTGNISFNTGNLDQLLFTDDIVRIGTTPDGEESTSAVGVAIGWYAGGKNEGNRNISIGHRVNYGNVSGAYLIGIGDQAGDDSYSNDFSTNVGYVAGWNTSGARQTNLGPNAGYMTKGVNAINLGFQAGQQSVGNNNIYIGHLAGYLANGNNNIEIVSSGSETSILNNTSNRVNIENVILVETTTGLVAIGDVGTGSLGTNLEPSAMLDVISTGSISNSLPVFRVEGTGGTLISAIDNTSTGVIFSVSDIGGLPLITADASGDVILIENGRYVGIATGTPQYQLDVAGTGNFHSGIRFADGTVQTTAPTGTGHGATIGATTFSCSSTQAAVPFSSLSISSGLQLGSGVDNNFIISICNTGIETEKVQVQSDYVFTSITMSGDTGPEAGSGWTGLVEYPVATGYYTGISMGVNEGGSGLNIIAGDSAFAGDAHHYDDIRIHNHRIIFMATNPDGGASTDHSRGGIVFSDGTWQFTAPKRPSFCELNRHVLNHLYGSGLEWDRQIDHIEDSLDTLTGCGLTCSGFWDDEENYTFFRVPNMIVNNYATIPNVIADYVSADSVFLNCPQWEPIPGGFQQHSARIHAVCGEDGDIAIKFGTGTGHPVENFGVQIQAAPSQTNNLLEFLDSVGNIISYINSVGDAVFRNLFVDGTLTYIDSTTVTIADKQLELASNSGSAIGNDSTVNDGGVVVKSTDGDKKLTWLDATDAWHSTENISLASSKSLNFGDGTTQTTSATGAGAGVKIGSTTFSCGSTQVAVPFSSLSISSGLQLGSGVDNNFIISICNTGIDTENVRFEPSITYEPVVTSGSGEVPISTGLFTGVAMELDSQSGIRFTAARSTFRGGSTDFWNPVQLYEGGLYIIRGGDGITFADETFQISAAYPKSVIDARWVTVNNIQTSLVDITGCGLSCTGVAGDFTMGVLNVSGIKSTYENLQVETQFLHTPGTMMANSGIISVGDVSIISGDIHAGEVWAERVSLFSDSGSITFYGTGNDNEIYGVDKIYFGCGSGYPDKVIECEDGHLHLPGVDLGGDGAISEFNGTVDILNDLFIREQLRVHEEAIISGELTALNSAFISGMLEAERVLVHSGISSPSLTLSDHLSFGGSQFIVGYGESGILFPSGDIFAPYGGWFNNPVYFSGNMHALNNAYVSGILEAESEILYGHIKIFGEDGIELGPIDTSGLNPTIKAGYGPSGIVISSDLYIDRDAFIDHDLIISGHTIHQQGVEFWDDVTGLGGGTWASLTITGEGAPLVIQAASDPAIYFPDGTVQTTAPTGTGHGVTIGATTFSCSSTQAAVPFSSLSISSGLQLGSGVDNNFIISICNTGIDTENVRFEPSITYEPVITSGSGEVPISTGLFTGVAIELDSQSGIRFTSARNTFRGGSTDFWEPVQLYEGGLYLKRAGDAITFADGTWLSTSPTGPLGCCTRNEIDISSVSGLTVTNADATIINASDIETVSGLTVTNADVTIINATDISTMETSLDGITGCGLSCTGVTGNWSLLSGSILDAYDVTIGDDLFVDGNTQLGLSSGSSTINYGTLRVDDRLTIKSGLSFDGGDGTIGVITYTGGLFSFRHFGEIEFDINKMTIQELHATNITGDTGNFDKIAILPPGASAALEIKGASDPAIYFPDGTVQTTAATGAGAGVKIGSTTFSCTSTQAAAPFSSLSISSGLQLTSGVDNNFIISICNTGIDTENVRLEPSIVYEPVVTSGTGEVPISTGSFTGVAMELDSQSGIRFTAARNTFRGGSTDFWTPVQLYEGGLYINRAGDGIQFADGSFQLTAAYPKSYIDTRLLEVDTIETSLVGITGCGLSCTGVTGGTFTFEDGAIFESFVRIDGHLNILDKINFRCDDGLSWASIECTGNGNLNIPSGNVYINNTYQTGVFYDIDVENNAYFTNIGINQTNILALIDILAIDVTDIDIRIQSILNQTASFFQIVNVGGDVIYEIDSGANVNVSGDINASGNILMDCDNISGVGTMSFCDGSEIGNGIATLGNLTTTGNLNVSGTLTYINSTTITMADKQLELASNSGSAISGDAYVDDGGIVLKSTDGDKKWTWLNATEAWHSTENITIATDKHLRAGPTGPMGNPLFSYNTTDRGNLVLGELGATVIPDNASGWLIMGGHQAGAAFHNGGVITGVNIIDANTGVFKSIQVSGTPLTFENVGGEAKLGGLASLSVLPDGASAPLEIKGASNAYISFPDGTTQSTSPTGDISIVSGLIVTNTTNIAATGATNAASAATNATNIATNVTNIAATGATNAASAATNATNIATNVTNIAATGATNAANITTVSGLVTVPIPQELD